MLMNIKRIILAVSLAMISFAAAAQTDAHKAAAEAAKAMTNAQQTEKKVEKPKYWKESLKTNINFGQTGLTNWAAGGDNTVSLAAYIDANANYAKDLHYWNNRLQLDYGFLYSSSKPIIQKNTDRIYLESKWGLKIPKAKNLSFTVKYDFRSQFTTGYNYLTPKVTDDFKDAEGNLPALDDLSRKDQIALWKSSRQAKSGLLSPAYNNLAVGIDLVPAKWLTLNIAPVTGSVVIVRDMEFRKNYGMQLRKEWEGVTEGVPTDGSQYRSARFELGAQVTADIRVNVNKNFSYSSQLKLFSNYLDKPQNLRVNWDNRFDWKLAKYFSLTITTNLIYDDKVMIFSEKDGLTRQRVQFKESLAFGFSWTIAK